MVLGSGVRSRFKKGKGKCLIVFVLFCFIILGLDDANPLCHLLYVLLLLWDAWIGVGDYEEKREIQTAGCTCVIDERSSLAEVTRNDKLCVCVFLLIKAG